MYTKEDEAKIAEIIKTVINAELARAFSSVVQAIADIKEMLISLSDNKSHRP